MTSVILVQLSDIPEDAVGGGTLMQEKHGNGKVREIRAPKAGYAYLMQGKVVWHAGKLDPLHLHYLLREQGHPGS